MDYKQSDEPRPLRITRAEGPAEVQINGEAVSIGIIGGLPVNPAAPTNDCERNAAWTS